MTKHKYLPTMLIVFFILLPPVNFSNTRTYVNVFCAMSDIALVRYNIVTIVFSC